MSAKQHQGLEWCFLDHLIEAGAPDRIQERSQEHGAKQILKCSFQSRDLEEERKGQSRGLTFKRWLWLRQHRILARHNQGFGRKKKVKYLGFQKDTIRVFFRCEVLVERKRIYIHICGFNDKNKCKDE